MNCNFSKTSPPVSIMMPTFNRRRYLPEALKSALAQDYDNFEIVLIRDGGDRIDDIVKGIDDPRIVFIDRGVNKGKAHSLNEGLSAASGKYICYLDDDDEFYPNHVRTLVDVLEDGERYQVAYSDLYKAHCRVEADGSRTILAKNVEITRDFDRMFMLHFNIALHVSLMHRRDLLEKVGPYNENLKILIDWDFTRRAAFFADFKHVHTITGQFYGPVGECDRISVQQRKNTAEYLRNVLEIKTTRPPKPWSKIKDLSIILLADEVDENLGKTIRDMWMKNFYPYKLHLPMEHEQLSKMNTEMPVLVKHGVGNGLTDAQKVDAVLGRCEGELVAVVNTTYPIKEAWIERGLNPLINSGKFEVIELEESEEANFAAVMPIEVLKYARQKNSGLGIRESLLACGFDIRKAEIEEYCFGFDSHLCAAKDAQAENDWVKAAQFYDYIRQNYGNDLWMNTMCANALFMAGYLDKAIEILRSVNEQRATVSTLLLQGKIYHKQNNLIEAIEQLEAAKYLIEGKTAVWTH